MNDLLICQLRRYIESDILQKLDFEDITEDCANKKTSKKPASSTTAVYSDYLVSISAICIYV